VKLDVVLLIGLEPRQQAELTILYKAGTAGPSTSPDRADRRRRRAHLGRRYPRKQRPSGRHEQGAGWYCLSNPDSLNGVWEDRTTSDRQRRRGRIRVCPFLTVQDTRRTSKIISRRLACGLASSPEPDPEPNNPGTPPPIDERAIGRSSAHVGTFEWSMPVLCLAAEQSSSNSWLLTDS